MEINSKLPDETVLRELGERIIATRLERNISQASLALKAGVSKRTIQRLESGQVSSQLFSFLRVCRALGIIEKLDALLPPPAVSPIDLLKLQGRKRQRAAKPTVYKQNMVRENTWTWDDKP